MRRLICILLVLVLLPVCSLAEEARKVFREEETDPFPEDAQLLTLTVCPLLGADCMLLTYGEHSMLVDVGKETQTKTVLEMLQNAGVESVESFFSTHPHGDHIGGFIPLIEGGLQVGTFYTVFPHDYVERKTAKHYMRDTLRLLAEKEIPVVDLKTGAPRGGGQRPHQRQGNARLHRHARRAAVHRQPSAPLQRPGEALVWQAQGAVPGNPVHARQHPPRGRGRL